MKFTAKQTRAYLKGIQRGGLAKIAELKEMRASDLSLYIHGLRDINEANLSKMIEGKAEVLAAQAAASNKLDEQLDNIN